MSRIGNQPIPVPKGVKLDINGSYVKVVGPKGTLERNIRPEIGLQEEGGNLIIVRKDNSKRTRCLFWPHPHLGQQYDCWCG